MRTLLIDNYDSFTHNLAHQIAAATGREPVVVPNDDPGWRFGRLDEFDAVVISPGPGTPERPGDVGICREVVRRCALPLFGVCLGHQGIAAWHGGTVGRAPEPRHGRISPVLHDGTGLFDGIPSPFEAVRYHSLAVTKLPTDLEATAWTPDGVLMGLRHRGRPQWGVQFHPESIRTCYGDRLLANFVALAAERRPDRESVALAPPAAPADAVLSALVPSDLVPSGTAPSGTAPSGVAPSGTPAPLRRVPAGAEPFGAVPAGSVTADTLPADPVPADPAPGARYEVLVEPVASGWDGEAVFAAFFRDGPYAYWLDSSRPGRGPEGGRFSVLGDAAGPLARVATADVWRGTITVRAPDGESTVAGHFLDWLDADLRATRIRPPDGPAPQCDFALGWVGYLGYELKAQCGGQAAHRSDEPDAVMVFADRAVVLDHVTGETFLLALAPAGDPLGRERAEGWLRESAERLAGPPPESPGPAPFPDRAAPIALRHDRQRYLDLIAIVQEEIAAGETYEVCLTNMAEAPADPDADPFEAYRALRRAAPAPFGAFLRFGETAVLSTSPERFLQVTVDGIAESRPIKGTRPRGGTPEEDAALRREMVASEKDRSENLMIVDLVRNDLGRCAEAGSVRVTGLFEVETYDTVHQLVSTVRARLRPGASAVDCVRAAFPGGSMTGAPKVRTMRIIDRLEDGPRGVYSGAIGYFSLTGAADLSIVIRTVVLTPGRIRYGTGGAVVALSDPEAEFEETAVKAAPLLALTGGAFPGRTGPAG